MRSVQFDAFAASEWEWGYFSLTRSRKLKMRYSELSLCDRIRTRIRLGSSRGSPRVNSRDLLFVEKRSIRGDRCRFCVKFSLPSISKMVSILRDSTNGAAAGGSSGRGSRVAGASRSKSGMSRGSSKGLREGRRTCRGARAARRSHSTPHSSWRSRSVDGWTCV